MASLKPFIQQALSIATNPKHTLWLAPSLLALDAILCALIIKRIPYTEIDWQAYMQQISQFLSGERSYPRIKGSTGPLVYPALHVYIYTGLYKLTSSGTDIPLAQAIFAILYLLTLGIVMACYRRAKAPPYVFPLLVLSKRVHSIFLLRCFNDCFAVFFLWAAVYSYQRRWITVGSLLFSLGVGVKMSLLLALPAFGALLLLTRGVAAGFRQAWLMAQVQIVLAFPFVVVDAKGYLSRAFELSRVFLFKWTVNWRFLGEEMFLSRGFSVALLVGHVAVLVTFLSTRWLKPAERSIPAMVTRMLKGQEPLGGIQNSIWAGVSSQYILTTVSTAMVVGMLFARSLHYQFYIYLAWASPALLWRSGMHPVLQYGLWAAQEWAWNVYPSTNTSSQVVVGAMVVTLVGVWFGTADKCTRRPTVPTAKAHSRALAQVQARSSTTGSSRASTKASTGAAAKSPGNKQAKN